MALLLGLPVSAAATHFDNMYPTPFTSTCVSTSPGGPFCQTDNASLYVHKENSLTTASKDNIRWTLDGSWNTTDLNVTHDSTPVYSGCCETDIIYQVNPNAVPGSLDGITWCDDAVDSQRCDQHYVAFDANTVIRALACHETGHAVGLTHGSQAWPQVSNTNSDLYCMTTPLTSDYVGPHNVGWVNITY